MLLIKYLSMGGGDGCDLWRTATAGIGVVMMLGSMDGACYLSCPVGP